MKRQQWRRNREYQDLAEWREAVAELLEGVVELEDESARAGEARARAETESADARKQRSTSRC